MVRTACGDPDVVLAISVGLTAGVVVEILPAQKVEVLTVVAVYGRNGHERWSVDGDRVMAPRIVPVAISSWFVHVVRSLELSAMQIDRPVRSSALRWGRAVISIGKPRPGHRSTYIGATQLAFGPAEELRIPPRFPEGTLRVPRLVQATLPPAGTVTSGREPAIGDRDRGARWGRVQEDDNDTYAQGTAEANDEHAASEQQEGRSRMIHQDAPPPKKHPPSALYGRVRGASVAGNWRTCN